MPYVTGTRRVRKIGLASLVAALLVGVLPTMASASWFDHQATSSECPPAPTSQRFASYEDSAEYSAVAGGTFEEGAAPGWSLTDAEVAPESEGPESTTGSLVIKPSGVAVSPGFCVSAAYPSFRFFVRNVSGGGALRVGLRWPGPLGSVHYANVATITGDASWALSPALELARKLPLWMSGSTLGVQLVFESESNGGGWFDRASGGTWAIDDVYVDPYRR